jgi:crotonobetainyl-CoA:carnitine CoA-transferase CaiB-like acyl-CoA transferase
MVSDNIFSGLKVVDLSSFIAGPSAAVILSDFGADVVRRHVENRPQDSAAAASERRLSLPLGQP